MTGVTAKELVLENFKSFGVKTRIPLKTGFTTISGPNGSGKSNLLDSLLFVLGLSSSKQLRAERLPDLITNQKGKTFARVALKLGVPVPEGGERIVEIARTVRVTKAGYTSTYYLDGRPVTLQKVHDSLNELGIGSQGGNVVLQGDVTRIITMSPLERRRLIDELAGVGEFDRKIEAAEGEIARAERHMEDCRLIEAELSSRLAALEQEREQAVKFQALERERDRLERQALAAEARELGRKAEGFRTDARELEESERAAEADLPKIAENIEKARRNLAEAEENLRRVGEGEKLEKLRKLEEMKARASTVRAEIAHIEGLLREGARRARSLQQGIERSLAERTTAEEGKTAALAAAEAERAAEVAARKNLEGAKAELAKMEGAARAKVAELTGQKDRQRELQFQLEAVRLAGGAARGEHARVEASAKEVAAELEALAQKLSGLKGLLEDADTTRADLEARLRGSEELLRALRARRQELLDRKAALEEEVRPLIRQVGAAEAAGQGDPTARALQILRTAAVGGVIGEAGSLLTVPPELSVAVAAAGGGRLKNIVVESDKVAARCIEELRRGHGPRMTFLPLNKIKGNAATSFLRHEGLVDYLINLVQFDEAYAPAFEYILGTTVLAEDLETARRYLGRYRLVTREGDLLDLSGAMTGGGAEKMKSASAGLAQVRAQLASKEAEARRLVDELVGIERRIKENEESRERAKLSLAELGKDSSRDVKDREALLDRRVQLKKRKADFDGELAKLAGAFEAKAREEDALSAELLAVNARVGALTEEIGAGEASRLQRAIEGWTAELEARRTGALAQAEEAKRRELEVGYLSRSIEGWQAELEEVTSKEGELAKRMDQSRAEAAAVEETVAQLGTELEGLTKELEILREEREKRARQLELLFGKRSQAEARIAVAREQLGAVKQKIAELDAARAEFEAKLAEKGGLRDDEGEVPALAVVRRELDRVQRALADLGPVNLLALEQFEKLSARRQELVERLAVLEKEKSEFRERIGRFADLKKTAFLAAYEAVDKNFRTIYAELSDGSGEIELENREDPFGGGLTLRAQPRNKLMKRLEALSGGEKSLAALAFIFSLQGYRPAPFYVFDEVDMFLDGRNTEKLAEMIQRRAEGTQFLVVSLRKAMLKRSFRTIGVTPGTGGNTRVTGLSMDEALAGADPAAEAAAGQAAAG